VSAAMHANNRVGPDRGYLYQLTAGLGWTSLPFLPLLRQQTLIMSGDDDPIIPLANGYLMRRLIPHSRLHVYHGGHLGLVTEAAQLAPVVAGFLAAADGDLAAPPPGGAREARRVRRAGRVRWARRAAKARRARRAYGAGMLARIGRPLLLLLPEIVATGWWV